MGVVLEAKDIGQNDLKMLSVHSLKFLRVFPVGFAVLAWQGELASAFWAFCHAALNYGWASSAG